MLNRIATTILAAGLTVAPTIDHPRPVRPHRWAQPTKADERAALAWIAAVLGSDAFQNWIDAVGNRGDYNTGDGQRFTGPECAGEWAIPTEIVWRESRCTNAENPTSSASGYYQQLDSSYSTAVRAAGLGQYAGHAAWAPRWVQDEAAEWLWANSPCHWAPNRWC